MTDELFQALENATDLDAYVFALEAAVTSLSQHKGATDLLLDDLDRAISRREELWRKAMDMPEYKAKYKGLGSHLDARQDYFAQRDAQADN